MVRSRVFGILAGYEDQNDPDALRCDAIFKLLANRLPDEDDLASPRCHGSRTLSLHGRFCDWKTGSSTASSIRLKVRLAQ